MPWGIVGVGNYLARRIVLEGKGDQFGRALEHFIHMELQVYNRYSEKDMDIRYWRTKDIRILPWRMFLEELWSGGLGEVG